MEQKLIDGGIYPYGYEYPDDRVPPKPDNWASINARLARPRASLSPSTFSDEKHEQFVRADARTSRERSGTSRVVPYIEGELKPGEYPQEGVLFANMEPLLQPTEGGYTLPRAKPDFYYGTRPGQLDRRVRDDLSATIVPSRQDSLPVAPNFFLEAKGPSGIGAVAKRQACYDGAHGARAMQSLQSYKTENLIYDNNTYTLSSIYSDGTLKMYAHHSRQPDGPGTRPEYYMHQIRSFAMTDTPETFRQGATAFRNARDWTEEQRNTFITQANTRVSTTVPLTEESSSLSFASTVEAEDAYSDSETSADELSLDIQSIAKRPSRSAEQSRSNQRRRTSITTSLQSTHVTQPAISWIWSNMMYHCLSAGQVIKQQREVPDDVWVYRASGWPGYNGKKWTYYDSGSEEFHFR